MCAWKREGEKRTQWRNEDVRGGGRDDKDEKGGIRRKEEGDGRGGIGIVRGEEERVREGK